MELRYFPYGIAMFPVLICDITRKKIELKFLIFLQISFQLSFLNLFNIINKH